MEKMIKIFLKKKLSIFNTALKLLQEEKQQGYQKFENMPQIRGNISNRMNIDNLAPWAREVATKAFKYLEKEKQTDQEKIKSVIFDEFKQKRADIDFGL